MTRSRWMRDVALAEEKPGPRGGRLWVLTLSCGHLVWRSARRGAVPPRSVECVPCWARANPGRPA